MAEQALNETKRWVVFALVGMGHLVSHIYILALPPLFALIKADLEVSFAALGMLVTAFHIATGAMQIPAGWAVDAVGARKTLVSGLTLAAASMALLGVAESYAVMMLLVVLAGIGNSVFHPADYAILSNTVAERHRGKAFGFHLLAGNLGFALAPILMVSLAAAFSWRWALVAVGVSGLGVALCMILFGQGLKAAKAVAKQPCSHEESGASRSFLTPALWVMLVFFILISMVTAGIQSFAVSAFAARDGLSLELGNAALSAFLTASFIGVALGGIIADKLRSPVLVVAGAMVAGALALAALAWLTMPIAMLVTAMAIAGAAIGLMRPARDLMVNAVTPPGMTGKAFGFVGTGLSVGGAIAPVTFGWLIDIGAPGHIFILATIFLALSVVAALMAQVLGANRSSSVRG